MRKFARIILNLGFPVKLCGFSVQNIVGNYNFGRSIGLRALAESCPDESTYEPELFPALKFSLPELKVAMNVFSTGKVVIFGKATASTVAAIAILRRHVANLAGAEP